MKRQFDAPSHCAQLAAELPCSASSASLRNFPAELESSSDISGLTKFRKFRSEALRNLFAELQNSSRNQSLRQVPQVPQNATPLRGVCVRVPKTRAHHTRGRLVRVRGPPTLGPLPTKPGSDGELRQEPRRRRPHQDHPLSETTMDFATLTMPSCPIPISTGRASPASSPWISAPPPAGPCASGMAGRPPAP